MNAKIPHPFGWLTGYLAILLGTGLTILVQSSSVFTSTLTPLVGSGVLHIKRMYPLTLGANIGTTFTAILASLAIAGDGFERSMQVALCHFFFNIIGVMVWYPIPAMRKIPVTLAKGKCLFVNVF
jgi:sodium-dependent phosphate cotransporter